MPGQIALLRKLLEAHFATPIFGLVVHGLDVPTQAYCISEAIRALLTEKGSRKLVDVSCVALQSTSLDKCFVAVGDVACEWLLTGVRVHVTLQLTRHIGAVAAFFNRAGVVSLTMHSALVLSTALEGLEVLPAHVTAEQAKVYSQSYNRPSDLINE